jgi:putative colanic acid biosynthesis UDP-glucose lipid carrier transferase
VDSGPASRAWRPSHTRSKNDPFSEQRLALGLLTRGVDLFSVLFSAVVPGLILFSNEAWPDTYCQAAILIALLLTIIVFERTGLYEPWRGRSLFDQAGMLMAAWIGVFIVLIISANLLKVYDHYNRFWVVTWFTTGYITLLLTRSGAMLVLRNLRSRGWNHKKIIIVGTGTWAREVANRIRGSDWIGLDIQYFIATENRQANEELDGIPVYANVNSLPALISENRIDEVWICLPMQKSNGDQENWLSEVLHLLRHVTVNTRMILNMADMRLLKHPIIEVLGMPVVNLNDSFFHGINRIAKFIEDKVIAIILLVLLSPLFLAIAVAVKWTSPGPVFFRQERHGWDGRPFIVYKYRTMIVHEEENGAVTQAIKNDARVTRIGRWLRNTSLDELPQFYNVLKGDMSIVGPRPHPIPKNEYYKDRVEFYMQRHKVKPGITGWAQVNGWRGETDTIEKMKRRVECDLYYIENWSIWFDFRIVLLTILRGFRNQNAY